jgi:hypothetical protein
MLKETDGDFSKDQLFMMEEVVLRTLQFHLTIASSHHFAMIFLRLTQCDGDHINTEDMLFLLYLSTQDMRTYTFVPSIVASAAIVLVRRQDPYDEHASVTWNLKMEKLTTHSIQNVEPCVQYLHELTQSKHERFLEVRHKFPQQTIRVWQCD